MKEFLPTIIGEANFRLAKNRFSEGERGFGQHPVNISQRPLIHSINTSISVQGTAGRCSVAATVLFTPSFNRQATK